MDFMFANDLHLTSEQPVARLDNVLQTSLSKLEYILQMCKLYKAVLFVAGDFTNRPRDWYLLPKLVQMLAFYKVPIYAVYGQHDQYMRNEDRSSTVLGVLAAAGLVTILNNEPVQGGDWNLYGASWGEDVPTPKDGKNLLLIHKPIIDKPIYPGQHYYDAGAFMKEHKGFTLISCGDVHRRFWRYEPVIGWYDNPVAHSKGKQLLINTGPIMRLEADEYNIQHVPEVALIISNDPQLGITWVPLPAKPGPEILTREHLETNVAHSKMLAEFVEAIKNPGAQRGMSMLERMVMWADKNMGNDTLIPLIQEICGIHIDARRPR